MFSTHNLEAGSQLQSCRLLARGAHHFFCKIDADCVAELAGLFCSRKQHRSATTGNVEYAVAGRYGGDVHEPSTEVHKNSGSYIVVGRSRLNRILESALRSVGSSFT